MKAAFLFGSGASVPANMPAVGEITQQVLSGEYPSSLSDAPDLDSQRDARVKFLRWLEIQVKLSYPCQSESPVNYENLYYLASQIRDDLRGEYDNPAVRPLVDRAFAELLPSINRSPGTAADELCRLAGDVENYIRRCVTILLRRDLCPLDYLGFVVEAFREGGGQALDILTLNHDTVLEQFFEPRGIPFVDGFAKRPNTVKIRPWDPATLQPADGAIRLLKLHGGVDWYRFRPEGVHDWHEEYVGIPTKDYLRLSPRDSGGRTHEWLDDVPIFLIGTFNKLAEYTDAVYLEIYYQAFRALQETDLLVTVGYGFGDKGINKLVADWMCRKLERRLVVVGRNADRLWSRARGAISGKWDGWLRAKRLFPLSFELEKRLSWSQISELLSISTS